MTQLWQWSKQESTEADSHLSAKAAASNTKFAPSLMW